MAAEYGATLVTGKRKKKRNKKTLKVSKTLANYLISMDQLTHNYYEVKKKTLKVMETLANYKEVNKETLQVMCGKLIAGQSSKNKCGVSPYS